MAVYDMNKMRPDYLTREYRRKVATGESLTLARLEAKQGSVTRPHCHDQEEVIFLLKGSWRFQLPTGAVTLLPNQVLTIPRGVEHRHMPKCAPEELDRAHPFLPLGMRIFARSRGF